MLVFQGNEYRNLEEQVRKNKEDIARHYEIDRAMANLGINIVGQVETEADLPSMATYAGNYGDTYAVGNKAEVEAGTASYSYYVWVGPDLNAGQPYDHWLNVGRISIVGPQGERGLQGERGPQGERGTSISAGASSNYYGTVNGDLYLVTSGTAASLGNVYVYSAASGQWVLQGNIRGPQGPQGVQGLQGERGPQGPQGPKGETGDVGGFINIAGIVATSDSLPLPSEIGNLTVAYLVGASAPYDLYVQVGSTSAEAVWVNAGPFNAATLVTVGGVGQNVWSADTKLDKVETSATEVYVHKHGTQGTVEYSQGLGSNAIVQRIGLDILVPDTPGRNNAATSKKYVDNNFIAKLENTSTTYKVYVEAPSTGGSKLLSANYNATPGEMPIMGGLTTTGQSAVNSTLPVGIPQHNYAAANKKYVDDNKGTKLYHHELTGVSGTASTGETITSIILVSTVSASITGGDENAVLMLYLSAVNSYIPYTGKITDMFVTSNANEVKLQFHNRLKDGEVESITLNVRRMLDTVTAL